MRFALKHLAIILSDLFSREHLGILDSTSDDVIRDVVSDSFYEVTLAELSRLLQLFSDHFVILSYLLLFGSDIA